MAATGNNRGDDGLWMLFFLLIIIWGGGWLIWKGFRPQIVQGMLWVRSAEMAVVDLWMDDSDIVSVPVPTSTDDERPLKAKLGDNERIEWHDQQFGVWKNFVKSASPEQINGDHIRAMSFVALYPLRWLIAGIMGGMLVWVIFNGPTSKFRRILGLETLMTDQAKTFKVIRPFLKFNPGKLPLRPPGAPVPAKLPLFAEALSPEEWIALNEIPMPDGSLDRVAAERAFARQLGQRWKGVNALTPELQVLLAGFALKASRKRNESDDLLGRLCCCWDHEGGLKLSRDRALMREARKILKDKKLSERILMNCNRHAYVSTALMRALNTAREEGGVLSPSQFLWLRGHNRALWYPLNNLGRQAFHMEALGACSHYRAEKQVNRPIPRPRVADAIEGLLEHLQNPLLARPIPPVDYGAGGKKDKGRNTGVMKPKQAA